MKRTRTFWIKRDEVKGLLVDAADGPVGYGYPTSKQEFIDNTPDETPVKYRVTTIVERVKESTKTRQSK